MGGDKGGRGRRKRGESGRKKRGREGRERERREEGMGGERVGDGRNPEMWATIVDGKRGDGLRKELSPRQQGPTGGKRRGEHTLLTH